MTQELDRVGVLEPRSPVKDLWYYLKWVAFEVMLAGLIIAGGKALGHRTEGLLDAPWNKIVVLVQIVLLAFIVLFNLFIVLKVQKMRGSDGGHGASIWFQTVLFSGVSIAIVIGMFMPVTTSLWAAAGGGAFLLGPLMLKLGWRLLKAPFRRKKKPASPTETEDSTAFPLNDG